MTKIKFNLFHANELVVKTAIRKDIHSFTRWRDNFRLLRLLRLSEQGIRYVAHLCCVLDSFSRWRHTNVERIVYVIVIAIVIVNSKLLKRHSKAMGRALAYSRALRQIRGVFQRIVRGKLRAG